MNTRFQITSAIAVIIFALPSIANAQIAVGAHGGVDFDDTDFFVGANATVPLGFEVAEKNLVLNPELSYWVTGDGYSLFIISANVLYPFTEGSISAYGGAGISVSFFSFDFGDEFDDLFGIDTSSSSTDIGLNAKGGAEFGEGKMRPFAEAGFFIKDGGFLYAQGGVRFQLGE
jgi:hypothetical protein